jgi:hypothetical protein
MARNPDLFSAEDISQTDHSLTVSFISTSSNYNFTVMNVYAPSDHRDTDMFLAKFEANTQSADMNWLAISDFNLTRSPSDKNNDLFYWCPANKFNSAIDGLALIELPLLDHLYTWSNKWESLSLARLDRVLINNAFATVFPNVALTSRIESTLDHIPLILNIPTSTPKTHRFRFENAWLKCPGFLPSTTPAWSNAWVTTDLAGELVVRIKAFRHAAKTWSR